MILVIGQVGFLGEVVEIMTRPSGQLKGVLEKVIDVVLVVVNKLVEGVKEKENALKNGKKEAQKELGSAKDNLEGAKEKLKSLSNKDNGSLKDIWEKLGAHGDREKSLPKFIDVSNNQRQVDPSKSTISEFIHKIIKTLIDQLAQGLQKWVGWQDGDECCLKGGSGESKGIGRKCDCKGGAQCCGNGGPSTTCHQCGTCGTSATGGAGQKCYQSAYCKKSSSSSSGNTEGDYYWPTISNDPSKVHLLARIFLGSVCLIWSGLSQLGFLTGGKDRWSQKGNLHEVDKGLGSFMAAMGYDLERLNQGK